MLRTVQNASAPLFAFVLAYFGSYAALRLTGYASPSPDNVALDMLPAAAVTVAVLTVGFLRFRWRRSTVAAALAGLAAVALLNALVLHAVAGLSKFQ